MVISSSATRNILGLVTAGLDPAVHAEATKAKRDGEFAKSGTAPWIAGSSPAMTT
jgi:hypothetical protein